MILTQHGINSLGSSSPVPPTPPEDSVLIGDKYYHYVRIGNLLWIDKNLDYKFTGLNLNPSNHFTRVSAFYWNRDDGSTYGVDTDTKCGLLYNGSAVLYLNDPQNNLLPDGWHVPTQQERNTLISAAGTTSSAGKLKQDNVARSPYWNGTNELHFNAVPAGYYDAADSAGFIELNDTAFFWMSTYRANGDRNYMAAMKLDGSRYISTWDISSTGTGGGFIDMEYMSVRLCRSAT